MNVTTITKETIFFRLKQLLSLYRIDIFDYIDVILVNNTDPTTMAYFTSLLKRAATEGDNRYLYFSFKKCKCIILNKNL